MKSTFVRLAVIALATTGFAASTIASHPSKQITKSVVIAAGAPLPGCGSFNHPCNYE